MSIRCVVWMAAALIWLGAGCSPLLFYQVQQTRTYDYEKRVPVLVNSNPAGATIVAADGRVLGQAPVIVDEAVRVRRVHRYCSTCMAIVGCIVDVAAVGLGISYANDHPDSSIAQAAGVVGVGMGLGCLTFAVSKMIISLAMAIDTPPQSSYPYAQSSETESILGRSVDLIARWDGLGESRVHLVLPGTRTTTLRLGRRYTFAEALVLWAQETSPPRTAENLYSIGSAYLEQARQGVTSARGHARSQFLLYIQLYPDGDQAEAARHGLAEVERLDGEAR